MTTPNREKSLGQELYDLVEESQGYAFISDDMGHGTPDAEVVQRARDALAWTNRSAKILRAFIRSNDHA